MGKHNTISIESRKILLNQQGMALILAISFLAIMSILASLLLTTSTSEIQLSGNFRTQQEAYYAAWRAVEYARVAAIGENDVVNLNTASDPLHPDTSMSDQISLQVGSATSGLDTDATTNEVKLLSETAPLGGFDATRFVARNYLIDATGKFPVDMANGARSRVQVQIMQIVQKSN